MVRDAWVGARGHSTDLCFRPLLGLHPGPLTSLTVSFELYSTLHFIPLKNI